MVRTPACHAGGRGFKSHPLRHFSLKGFSSSAPLCHARPRRRVPRGFFHAPRSSAPEGRRRGFFPENAQPLRPRSPLPVSRRQKAPRFRRRPGNPLQRKTTCHGWPTAPETPESPSRRKGPTQEQEKTAPPCTEVPAQTSSPCAMSGRRTGIRLTLITPVRIAPLPAPELRPGTIRLRGPPLPARMCLCPEPCLCHHRRDGPESGFPHVQDIHLIFERFAACA